MCVNYSSYNDYNEAHVKSLRTVIAFVYNLIHVLQESAFAIIDNWWEQMKSGYCFAMCVACVVSCWAMWKEQGMLLPLECSAVRDSLPPDCSADRWIVMTAVVWPVSGQSDLGTVDGKDSVWACAENIFFPPISFRQNRWHFDTLIFTLRCIFGPRN